MFQLCITVSSVQALITYVVLQIVRKHYGHFAKQEATLRVRFEHSKITLDIPEDGQVTKDGWRITPRTHPTVSDVNRCLRVKVTGSIEVH